MWKYFWALPAALRLSLVLAAQRPFSVSDDLLAYPQYKVQWLDDYVTDAFAETKLRRIHKDAPVQPDQNHIQQYEPPPIPKQEHGTRSSGVVEEDVDYEMMVVHKQRFLCAIPNVAEEEDDSASINETTIAQQREEEAKELARAKTRGWELLQGMQGHCVYYVSGWWSYSFCFDQDVKQFHALAPTRGAPMYPPQEDPNAEGYVLGTYGKSSETAKVETGVATTSKQTPAPTGELVAKGDSRYLVQKLEGGTICDLTGKGRRIEIQYHCNPGVGIDRISLIKELSTCSYLMIVQTPRLCNDVAFLPPQQDKPNEIVCRPVLKPGEVDDYLKEIASVQEALDKADAEKTAKIAVDLPPIEALGQAIDMDDLVKMLIPDTKAQIVGDIVVGGHNIVPEDMELEKSAIVGGGKTTFIDTVASSDGKMISKAEMEKLGSDYRTLEKLKKELVQMAKGRSWRLDLVDTPRGREYRGFIDDQENNKLDSKDSDEKDESTADKQEGSKEEYFLKEEL